MFNFTKSKVALQQRGWIGMLKIPINNTLKDRQRLHDECMACEENRQFDLLRSIRERSMTRESYYEVHSTLRKFVWGLKQNKFLAC